ncbi:hypothetical protein [Sphingobium sp. WCS2017Hpa-17]|uniref:hypothetical protein n=1 Tax=Sphingobium sp. WCS2017Hpa-17 TaxID=3073638 RepID=UPI002889DEDF|nr:hypothetical protein [Sphingobium sp. WCS2017Hpa-17]
MYAVSNRERHNITAQKPREAIGDAEFQMRKAAHRDGSAALCERIEALIVRTADRIDVPASFAVRRLDFARAYLGFEVADGH